MLELNALPLSHKASGLNQLDRSCQLAHFLFLDSLVQIICVGVLFLIAQRTAIPGHSIWTSCSTVVLLQHC